jgi:PhnB protein
MLKLTSFLLFDGNCADALTFYQSCLGGELSLLKVADSPVKDHMPPAAQNRIVYAQLKGDGFDLSASDWLHPVRTPRPGNTVCLFLTGGTFDESKTVFDKLSGQADPALLDPVQKSFFGFYGALTDKFGVRWMFKGD